MAHPNRFGRFSLISGVLAIPTATVGIYLRSVRVPGSGFLLGWFEKLGLVNRPAPADPSITVFHFPPLEALGIARTPAINAAGVPEMSEASYFSINDENAIALLIAVSAALALAAMATALWAEYRREPTLYLSAGYVCGALAIAQVQLLAGLVSFIAGIAVVLVVRHQRES